MPPLSSVTRRLGLKTAVAAAVVVPVSGAALSPQRASAPGPRERHLEVMSFNLRYASGTGPHRWAVRRPAMRALLGRERPHVIGTQEGLYAQVRDIAADLGAEYAWLGTGRAGGSRDEFVAVFYDTRRLTPVQYDHFWLSDTPDVIGSNTWGGACIRMVTWVSFRDAQAPGREFYVLNTHLDNKSQHARARAASLIADRIAGLDRFLPLVVTGDFNAPAHKNPAYDTLLGAGLVDTWDTAAERTAPYGTFHGYRPPTAYGDRIDWILATPGVTAHWACVNTFAPDGRFPSDHLPVQASLTLG
ncbi:endonuclease/exonuclease/phosphatase family protein [Streptomyces sp. NPDC093261]|uniref:endonuclease/exonuclease/phosphatase family protein n=1 Tax=Streptomyces sp. NPDC093261 TaxID=3366037 RepID=UPI0037F9B150